MEAELAYVILEYEYAQRKNIELNDDYPENISKILPTGWYLLDDETRIYILKEALEKSISLEETDIYKNQDTKPRFQMI